MAADGEIDTVLRELRRVSGDLVGELATIDASGWALESTCPPWRVADIAAHVVNGGTRFCGNIRGGLGGSLEPFVETVRDLERRRAVEGGDAPFVAGVLAEVTEEFLGLYDGLGAEDLAAVCFHPRGNRSVAWYASHRLAEVAFHRFDIASSLGREADLGDEVAGLLLPTLLESNAPRTYAAGRSRRRGGGERYLLSVDGDPTSRWQVTIGPEALETHRGDGPFDLSVTGPAGALALVVYGRRELSEVAERGEVSLEGEAALVEAFSDGFPRP